MCSETRGRECFFILNLMTKAIERCALSVHYYMTLSKTGLKDIGHENCHWYGGQEDVVRLVRRTIVCANQFLSLKARVCLCFSCAPSLKIYERKWIVNVPVQGAIWRWTTPTATSISKNAGNVCVTTKYAFTVKGKRKMIHSCGMLLNGFIQGGAFIHIHHHHHHHDNNSNNSSNNSSNNKNNNHYHSSNKIFDS
ncbi:hypothetical protein Naga_100441g2 [Nannochloropsis gaditana]|uniref:Uncharacterized protein n=1 Tax=Nannochloropsis gaditana TaxID=72520 RepID=W7TRS3_9STRA|nr:hypothetical protein Naga_100441g2 [Nannochloropsis gaditana]